MSQDLAWLLLPKTKEAKAFLKNDQLSYDASEAALLLKRSDGGHRHYETAAI